MPKAKVIDCDQCGIPFKQVKSRHARFCSTECRLLAKVEFGGPDDCWLWTGITTKGGYGRLYHEGSLHVTHRLAYTFWLGEIPEGLFLDHLCRVRNCVNPSHLEPVTHAENMRRGMGGWHHAAKTECPRGHPYDDVNTYQGTSGRACRVCQRMHQRNYYARKRNAPEPFPEMRVTQD